MIKEYIDQDDPSQEKKEMKILSRLGEGGQAKVFKVEINEKLYALKMYKKPNYYATERKVYKKIYSDDDSDEIQFFPKDIKYIKIEDSNGI